MSHRSLPGLQFGRGGPVLPRGWRLSLPAARGLAISTIVHAAAAFILMWVTLSQVTAEFPAALEMQWGRHELPIPLDRTPLLETAFWDGGESAFWLTAVPQVLTADSVVSAPASRAQMTHDAEGELFTAAELAERVGGSLSSGGRSTGAGTGLSTGAGTGGATQPGFFGISTPGQRFVYVVDSSNSMNAPHEEAQTRFQRLKLELVRSIGLLREDQAFFVIFFSTQTHPMPATEMQRALPVNKQRYLEWVARMRADGGTDPADAIRAALALRPDVIYLLTDGSFAEKTARRVRGWNERRVTIHTFCFGEKSGEKLLRRIADENGGFYHFVP